MPDVVLECVDESLIQAVGRATAKIRGAKLRVRQTGIAPDWPNVAVVLLHAPTAEALIGLGPRIQHLRLSASWAPLLVVCDEHDTESFIKTLKLGVLDCLCRPLNLKRLAFLVESMVVRHQHLQSVGAEPAPESAATADDIEFRSPTMMAVVARAKRAAELDSTVLITGETGVGKNVLGRLIHHWSRRRTAPFLSVNCAALSEHLLESELFGHRRGAFTGADRDHGGVLKQVGRGTLMLDEINSLSLSAQGKLLHAADGESFMPVGTSTSESFQGRLIVSSNVDLEELVAEGRFRADLFFRLNVLELEVPPLRLRRSEIRPLAEGFLRDAAQGNQQRALRLSPEAVRILEGYAWPGNVRELKNTMQRAAAYCTDGMVTVDDLPLKTWQQSAIPDPDEPLMDVYPLGSRLEKARMSGELAELVGTLRQASNKTEAARILGISRAALYQRLKKHGLSG